jgi:NAD(P)-dependent dehydrogenase (short-subunit alcohol dehydrogenase family)
VICDVGDQQAVVAAMAETVGALGRVDSCFVNAGVGGRGSSFLDMTDEEWKRVLRVNLDGARYTAQEALRHMVKRWEDGDTNGGSLVFTSSGSAFFGQPRGEHYASSKGAVLSMSRAIAVEFARYGVRSNAIVPGWIDTELASGALHWDKFIERNMPRTPARRWGSGDDFAGIAAYLASPAASYHTGDIITIDGGYYIA